MTTTIKITELTDIGANLAGSTLVPVVNMAGTPVTQRSNVNNLANYILNTGTGANLGPVEGVVITGGTDGQVLSTDGNGVLSWVDQSGGGNANTGNIGFDNNIIYSLNGLYLDNSDLTHDATAAVIIPNNGSDDLQVNNTYGNIWIQTGKTGTFTAQWKFDNDGNLTLPSNTFTINYANGAQVPLGTGVLSGDGGNISNIQGANVSGTVGNANLSQYIAVSDVNNNFSYHVVLSAGSGDKSIHIDADDNLQYNPADGTLTSVRVDAQYILGNLNYSTGYPASNVVGLGNIATANFDGNSSNALLGNGSWGPVEVTSSQIANGTSNVNIPTSSGAVEVTAGTQHWAFGTDGTLTAPNDSQIVPAGNNFNLYTNGVNGAVQFFTDVTGNNHNWSFDGYGYTNLPFSQGYSNTAVIATVGAGNIMLQAGAGPTQNFIFGANGNLTFPDNSGSSWPINQQRFGMGNIGAWLDGQWTIGEFSGNGVSGQVGIRIDPAIEGNTGITLPSQADSVTQRVSIYNTGGGGIELYTGANNWEFGADGNLTLPNDANIATIGNVTQFNTCTNGFLSLNSYDAGGNNIASLAVNSIDGLVGISTYDTVTDSDYQWAFNITGGTIFPTLTVDLHNGGNQTAQTLQFGDPSQQAIITGPTPAVDTNAQRLIIQGQRGSGTGEGGDVYFWAGDADTNGGDIKIYAGDADSGTGSGGYINIDAGNGPDSGGQLSLTGGYSSNGQGGTVNIGAGQGGTDGGAVNINGGGAGTNQGGNIALTGGYGGNNGGEVRLTGGSAGAGLPGYGNVVLVSGASTWTFDNTGNLSLPSGGSVYSEGFTPSGAPGNTIILNPHGSGSITNQKLMVYPTAGDGDHIHMVTGNLYQTELFLGNDNFYVKLANTGNVVINTNDDLGNTGTWTFGTNGNLTIPKNIVGTNSGAPLIIDAGTTLDSYVSVPSFTDGYEQLSIVNKYTYGNGIRLETQSGNWLFGGDGVFTVPGSITANVVASPAPSLSGFSSLQVFDNINIGSANIAGSSTNIIISGDINSRPNNTIAIKAMNDGADNPAQLVSYTVGTGGTTAISAYANNALIQANINGDIKTWVFDNTGNMTLPGNTFAVNYANGTQVSLGGGTPAGSNNEIQFNSNGAFGASGNYTFTDTIGGGSVEVGNELLLLGNGTISTSSNNLNIQPAGNLVVTSSIYNWTFDTAGNLTLPGNTFAVNYANGSQASAPLVDVLNTNGLSTVFYPTFVENRTDGQIVRADVDLSYRSDTNTLTVGNLSVAGVVATANISTTGYFISGNQATGGFQLGNSNSRLKSGDSNSYMTMGQNPAIYPDTAASATAGVLFGGNGYLLGNNGSRCITLNYGGGSGVVGLNSNLQVGASGSGTVLVPGTVTTGVNSILAGPTFTPLANTMAGFVANVNYYSQLTIQNKNTGADATVDFIATADNGSDTVNYLDMGIINSGYDANTPTNSLGNIVFAADSYMYAQGNTGNASQSGGNLAIGTSVAGKNVKIFAGGVDNTAIVANIANTGVAITGNLSVSGNISGNTAGYAIGYLNIPQVSASNTTLALTDAGKHYYSTTAGNLTLTIPLNSSVAFPTGTAISIVVQAAGNILVNAASGVTLYMAGNSTSANRVVGTYGMATLMKVASDTWFINGTGVS